ncbi:MAG: hypothetical protein OK439_04760 [Thaumarchaeota archaeon]|nr:hypothetical protein [Nitrososphaerota archaeon]
MQHFLNLDKCNCGAYRYMAVREHKKSYEIYLIHHTHLPSGQDTRKYAKLASIPKFRLNLHDERTNEISTEKILKLTFEQSLALRSVLSQLDNPKEKDSVSSDLPANDLDFQPGETEEVIAE